MRYFSTFSGIGGFEKGIEEAYESLCNAYRSTDGGSKENQTGDKGQGFFTEEGEAIRTQKRLPSKCTTDMPYERPLCIGYSEIDKYAVQIYQSHFSEHKNYGDITKINAETLPDFDLLVGGFPCQSFSIAGKRMGFEDTRGTMFFELARILRAKQPRLFVFENVKGLLSHDNGQTFRTIISTLDELGYDCQWQVLNSKNHGVPQNRERVFIVGHLRGTPRPQVFPFGQDGSGFNERKSGISGEVSTNTTRGNQPDINSEILQNGQDRPICQLNQPTHSNDRVYGADGISPTLNTMQGGNRQPFVQQKSHGYNNGGKKFIAPTLTKNSYEHNNHVNAIRRLTPTECERLQGFPDGWTEGVSDTQRYKTLGNAVTVNVIRDIFTKLINTSS